LKEWILYNWKLISWAIFLSVTCTGILLFNLKKNEANPEYDKVEKYCLEIVRKIEGIELDPLKTKAVPIGARIKLANYSGIMMVWERETSGISVKCSVVSQGNHL